MCITESHLAQLSTATPFFTVEQIHFTGMIVKTFSSAFATKMYRRFSLDSLTHNETDKLSKCDRLLHTCKLANTLAH